MNFTQGAKRVANIFHKCDNEVRVFHRMVYTKFIVIRCIMLALPGPNRFEPRDHELSQQYNI